MMLAFKVNLLLTQKVIKQEGWVAKQYESQHDFIEKKNLHRYRSPAPAIRPESVFPPSPIRPNLLIYNVHSKKV